ncbi:MAG: GNAT family N-acetyltransferase [Pirellulaceae bacterium]
MIRQLTVTDIERALELCRSAGWNQTAVDWLRLIEHEPLGCFVAERDNLVVGTVTSTRYENDLAWIGMMLVDQRYRRQGIGTRLMNTCLEYLRAVAVGCIKLDATPAGQPVYQRLGFQVEGRFHRWSRDSELATSIVHSRSGTSLAVEHLELDRAAFGADRASWLQRLAADSQLCLRQQGFGMLRHGFLANYLGPVIAKTEDVARDVIHELLTQSRGQTFWDIPHDNTVAIQLAQSLNFKPGRDLTRMWLGSRLLTAHMKFQFALADPSTG